MQFDFAGGHDSIESMVLDSQGRLVVGGYAYVNGRYQMVAARLNATTGAFDNSFSGDGRAFASLFGLDAVAFDIALDAQDNPILGGYTENSSGAERYAFAKFRASNGTLDSSFGTLGVTSFDPAGLGEAGHVVGLAVQLDGKIAYTGTYNGFIPIGRLNANGSRDTTFFNSTGVNLAFVGIDDKASDLLIVGDNKILAVGTTNPTSADEGDFFLYQVNGDSPLVTSISGASGNAGTPITFTIQTSDVSKGDLAAGYRYYIDWNGDGITDQQFNGAANQTVTHTFTSPQTNRIRLTAVELVGGKPLGYTHSVQRAVQINYAPTAFSVTTDAPTDTQQEILLSGIDNNPEVAQNLTYQIVTQPSHGTLGAIVNGRVSYTSTGGYKGPDSFTYRVVDDASAGGSALASAAATVSINVVNAAPALSIGGPSRIEEGQSASYTATFTDKNPGDTHSAIQWRVLDQNQTTVLFTGSGPSFAFTPPDSGNYRVEATVTDSDGAVGGASSSLQVDNIPPTVTISGSINGITGQTRTFYLTATDPNAIDQAGAFAYEIDPGLGSYTTTTTGTSQKTVTASFAGIGTYTVRVRARDKDGDLGPEATHTVVIEAPLASDGPINAATNVNTVATDASAAKPVVAMHTDGSHVIAWAQTSGSEYDIYFRRYDASGNPLSVPTRAHAASGHYQRDPALVMDSSGNFLIVWDEQYNFSAGGASFSERLKGQLFNASGVAVGSEMTLATNADSVGKFDVAMNAAGNFAVAWSDFTNLYVNRYSSAGALQGSAITIAPQSVGYRQTLPAIAMDAGGGFVVTWKESLNNAFVARRYDSAGQAVGGILGPFGSNNSRISINMQTSGGFIFTVSGNSGITARFFAANGTLQSSLTVDDTTDATNLRARLAIEPDGDMVFAWTGFWHDSQGGNYQGVRARRYSAAGVAGGPVFSVATGLTSSALAGVATDGTRTAFVWGGVVTQLYGINYRPTTIDIAPVVVAENAAPTTINLPSYFSDTEDAASALNYSVLSVYGTPGLFSSATVNGSKQLVLSYAFNANGSAIVIVRATDSSGGTIDTALSVTVTPSPTTLPRVVSINPGLVNGRMPRGATSLQVTFNKNLPGADQSTIYELRRAGVNGLVDASDPLIPVTVTYSPTLKTVTLTFAALVDDTYRLIVRDTVLDASGNRLDGDGNGVAGGEFVRDFVVGVGSALLPSPGGYTFDPETSGVGAGQLVQGPSNAFDGLTRLQVGGADFSPGAFATTPSLAVQTASSLSGTPSNTNYGNWSSLSVTIAQTGLYRLSTTVNFSATGTTGADAAARYTINDVAPVANEHHLLFVPRGGNPSLAWDDYVNLNAGDIVRVQVRTEGASINGGELRVAQLLSPPVGSAPAFNEVMSSSTSSLSRALADVPGLTFTVATAGDYLLSSSLALEAFASGTVGLAEARFAVNGVVLSVNEARQVLFPKSATSLANNLDLEEYVHLNAGDVVTVQARTPAGDVRLHSAGYAQFLRLLRFTDAPASAGPAVSVNEVQAVRSEQIYTFSQPVSGLTFTATQAGEYRLSTLLNVRNSSDAVPATVAVQFKINNSVVGVTGNLSFAAGALGVATLPHEVYRTLNVGDVVTVEVKIIGAGSNDPVIYFNPQGATQLLRAALFSPYVDYALDDSSQTLRTASQTLAGLQVTREVTVPATGAQSFARTMDVFQNTGASPVTTTVRIVGNLGTDAGTTVFATSDGDALVEVTDRWFGTDDADGSGSPAIIHQMHGWGGVQPASVNVAGDSIEWSYNLTVPVGQTVRLAHYTILANTRAAAQSAADFLIANGSFGGQALAFLSAGEIASLANLQANRAPTNLTLSGTVVSENATVGAAIGTFSTTDSDANNAFTYTLAAGGVDNVAFNIVGDQLVANTSLNFETKTSYAIRVRTTDQYGAFFEAPFSITVTNAPPGTPTDNDPGAPDNVPENAANSTYTGITAVARDVHGGNVTFTLSNSAGGRFAIHPTTGVVSVANGAPLDFEAATSHTITVVASDGALTSSADFTITLTDANDVVPIIAAGQSFQRAENSANGTVVGTLAATDGDATPTTFQNWTITGGNSANAFALNAATGQITVANRSALDRETIASFTLQVTVSDGVNTSASQNVTINLLNLNDVAPVITSGQAFSVFEGTVNGTIVGAVNATDGDVSLPAYQDWTITAGNAGGAFAIDPFTGEINVANSTALSGNFTLQLTVSDGVQTSALQTVNIEVAPTGNSAAFDGSGNLVITDNDAMGLDNRWTLYNDGAGNLVVTDTAAPFTGVSSIAGASLSNGGMTLTIPLASVGGTHVILDGQDGNDALTTNMLNPLGKIVVFNGGAGGLDSLHIAGGSQGVVTYRYANTHDGNVTLSNFGAIEYTGLEPITNHGAATDVIFHLPATANAATLSDDGVANNGLSRLSGATFETTTFSNPTGTVTIHRGSANDTLTIESLPDFTANLTLGSTAAPFNRVAFSQALNTTRQLAVFADTIAAQADVATTGNQTYQGSMLLSGNRAFTSNAGGAITFNGTVDATTAGVDELKVNVSNGAAGRISFLGDVGGSTRLGRFEVYSPVEVRLGGNILTDRSGGHSGYMGFGGATRLVLTTSVVLDSEDGDEHAGEISLYGTPVSGDAPGRDFSIDSSTTGAGKSGGRIVFANLNNAGGAHVNDFTLNNSGSFTTDIHAYANAISLDENGADTGDFSIASGSGAFVIISLGLLIDTEQGNNGAGGSVHFGTSLLDYCPTVAISTSTTAAGKQAGNITFAAARSFSTMSVTATSANAAMDGVITFNAAVNPASNGSLSASGGEIRLPNSNSSITTNGTGNLSLDASRILSMANGSSLAAAMGNITLLGNAIDLFGAGVATSNTVTIMQHSTDIAINLGGVDGNDTLGLSDSELDQIFAPALKIGSAASGPINVSGNITRTANTHINILSGSSIDFTTGQIDSAGGNVTLDAGTSIGAARQGVDVKAGTGIIAFGSGDDLALFVNGTGADVAYSQLNVNGTVNLSGLNLVVSGSYTPTPSDSFVIVNNDEADPIIGTFDGRPEGGLVTINSVQKRITYVGGTGNDVALLPLNRAPTLTTTPTSIMYSPGGTALAIDNGINIIDPDSDSVVGATVAITANLASGDVLGFTNQDGIVGSYSVLSGVLTLTGPATLSNYRDALRSVTFSSSGTIGTQPRTVAFQVNDGGTVNNLSNIDTRAVLINQPPVLSPIANQVFSSSNNFVDLIASDPNNDPLAFSANVTSVGHHLRTAFPMKVDLNNLYLDYGAPGAKWFQSSVNASIWYFILPNGEFHRWNNVPNQAAGPLLLTVDTAYHANPALITSEVAGQGNVTVAVQNNRLTFGATGPIARQLRVTAVVSDGVFNDSEVFLAILNNQPPVLQSVPNQTMSPATNSITVPLSASDPDNDPLIYSAIVQSQAQIVKAQIGSKRGTDLGALYDESSSNNYGRLGDKWLSSRDTVGNKIYYYILPSGDLFRWDGTPSVAQGTFIANVGTNIYMTPGLLINPLNPPATTSFAGSDLTVDPAASFRGTLVVTARATDTRGNMTTRVFTVTVAPAPILTQPNNIGITGATPTIITLSATDPSGLPLTYSVTSEAMLLKTTYNLRFSGNLYTNYLGLGEKWLLGAGPSNQTVWYYVTPAGQLFRWQAVSGNPVGQSTLVRTIDTRYHTNPALLYNAHSQATYNIVGNVLTVTPAAGFTGTLVLTVFADNGAFQDNKTFTVTVI